MADTTRRGSARKGRDRKDRDADEKGGWGEVLKSVLIAGALFLIIRTFILQTFFITSGSMEDTMLVGDFLVVNRAAIGTTIPGTDLRVPGYSEVRRGDVLVFDPHHTDQLKLVKRLVGMPGDTLEMRDRVLYRNGVEQDEPYVKVTGEVDATTPDMLWQRRYLLDGMDPAAYTPSRDDWGPIVLPEGEYFLLGDNRDNSLDSRFWGPLDGERFEGRVSFIYYSYDQDSYEPLPALTTIRWGRIFDRIR